MSPTGGRRWCAWFATSLCSLCSLVTFSPARAGVAKIELPAETASFKPGAGSEIANGQCLVCHSVEYVTTQPALPRTYWSFAVKKMRDKFGAPIPEDQVEPLVNYLSVNYGSETNLAVTAAGGQASAPANTAEALATKYGCLGCHNVSTKIVGPPYKDVAAKYREDAGAVAKIGQQIHQGGSGKWGPIIMPPFPMISDAEIKTLADWILSQK
jgi:sulfite dehydrogenase